MIKCNYIILSEGITLDQITGLASVHNALEKISTSNFPFVVNKIAMLSFFERKPNDPYTYEIERKLFNNDTLLKNEKVNVDFKDKLKHKWINIFQGIELKEDGELRLSVYHDGKEINRYSIEVEKK
ncbi:hypothetical protein K9M48_00495 [Candidatus Gracilibacteria bacterium]|nr:hypothetical protein [Candidatus Gracilibacteria bacterium]